MNLAATRSLGAVFCAVALSVTSTTCINVALPVIAGDLGVSDSAAIAVVQWFQLALVATLLPFAALGERWGYRGLFKTGLAGMALASLACAWAPSLGWLIAARLLQALAGSAIMAVSPALLRLSVPSDRLATVIGLNATVVAVFGAAGPSIAAGVLALSDWRGLFLLNLPWVALGLALGHGCLPHNGPASQQRPFDTLAATLNIALFVSAFSGLHELPQRPALGLALLLLSASLLWALLRHQRHQAEPLLPLDLLRIPVVRVAVMGSVGLFSAQLAAMVALPFLLHQELGLPLLDTGLIIMAWPATVAVMASLAAWLLRYISSAWLCACGGLLLALGLLGLAALPAQAGASASVAALLLCGLGFGCFQTPNNRSMIGATPRHRSGSAGGLQATARLSGHTLGSTLASILFLIPLPGGATAPRVTLLTAAALALAAGLVSLMRREGQTRLVTSTS